MATATDIRLMLASPNSLELFALTRLASRIPNTQICTITNTVKTAIQAMQRLRPHVAVLDAEFADPLCRVRDVQTRVLLLAAPHGVHGFPEACNKLICGVLDRASSLEKIGDAIERVARCTRPVHDYGACEHCPLPRVETRQGGGLPLSRREMQVFLMIGRGLGTAAIARELHLSVKTIETHRENIKRKLDLANAPDLLWAARRWQQGKPLALDSDVPPASHEAPPEPGTQCDGSCSRIDDTP